MKCCTGFQWGCCSVAQSCSTFCDPMDCSTPGFPVRHQLPEFTQTHVHRVGDAIPPSHPLSPLLLLPSIFPSIRNFSNESAVRVRWPKYCSFSISISPSNKYSGLISLKMDWFDLLAVQGTLRSLLQHHSSKASILQHPPSLRFSSHNCMWLKKKMYTTKLKNNTVGKTVPVDLLNAWLLQPLIC